MKVHVLFIIAAVVLMSCAGTASVTEQEGSAAGPGATAGTTAPTAKQERLVTVEIPVEKKSTVKFADGTVDQYTVFDYNDDSTLLLSQSRFSASGTLLEKTEYIYDAGKLMTKTVRDETGKVLSQVQYDYDGAGNPVRETLLNAAGKPISSSSNEYDPQGRRTVHYVNNAAGSPLARTVYTYKDGVMTASETFDAAGTETGYAEFTYDGAGNLSSQRVFSANGSPVRIIKRQWENGREIKIEQAAANGQVQRRESHEYGSKGELLRTTIENIQGKSTQLIEREYSFRTEQRTIYE